MPSTVSWPEMVGPTAHPTGATLALGDPPNSLNAPGRGRGYHLLQGVPGFVPWVVPWRFPAPVASASAAIGFGQGSGKQSDPPRRRGNTTVAFCPTAVLVHESRDPLLHTQSTGDGLGYMGAARPWLRVVAVWPRGWAY